MLVREEENVVVRGRHAEVEDLAQFEAIVLVRADHQVVEGFLAGRTRDADGV